MAANNAEITPINQRGIAAMRAAEALLRTLGGGSVMVRIPVTVEVADNSGELGLSGAASEDVTLSPAVVRTSSPERETELLISAGSLVRARELKDAASVRDFFNSALGIIVEGRLLQVRFIRVDEVGGTPYLYRLRVTE